MGLFVPVVDQERARSERGRGGDDDASRAHRAFHDPHSLHRGSRPDDDTERDVGSRYAKKGKLVQIDGKWVKPPREEDAKEGSKGNAPKPGSEPQRFIPEKTFKGKRLGYYFTMGKQGLGYYCDNPRYYRSNQWKDTWDELQAGDARAKHARREETKAARDDRRDASAYDPHDYRGGRDQGRSRDRSHPYKDEHRKRRSRSGSRDRGRHRSPPREMTREEKEKAALDRLLAKRGGGAGGGHHSHRPGGGGLNAPRRKFGDL